MTASLETYLRRASPRNIPKIFNDVPGQMPPMLSKTRTNRILLYNGCFNPPHQGHRALLEHTFHNSGEDLNVVAAVVLVAGNQYIRWKLAHESPALRLTLAQRMQLWDAELEGRVNWCFVCPEDAWFPVEVILGRELRRDGFAVEYVNVAGGDKVSQASQAQGVWGCRSTITSNICRPVDFYPGDDSAPQTLRNHGPWRRVEVDKEILRERAQAKVLHSYAMVEKRDGEPPSEASRPADEPIEPALLGEIEDVYQSSLATALKRELWVCDHATRRRYSVRFVASEDQLDPTISSEKIRGIIGDSSSNLEEELWSAAMTFHYDTHLRNGLWNGGGALPK